MPNDPTYVPQPYPSTRYHETKGRVTVIDVADEITKCGEACDTSKHTVNRLGWRDRPYAASVRPKPVVPPPMPGNIADLVILMEKSQMAIGRLESRISDLDAQLLAVRDRLAFVEEMVASSAPAPEPEPRPTVESTSGNSNKKRG